MHCIYVSILVLFTNLFNKVLCQSHAFIQVDNELKYLVDGVPVLMSGIHNLGDNEEGFENIYDERVISKNYLVFDPPFLDFKEHPTGMPLMKKVYVQNTSPDISIHLHSLSGNTMHFHCTFFQDKVISPGSNTSFDVVFLGREEGFIENTIYVHTSIGIYRYWVKAVGTSNPYRVRPLIGVRMPLNSSYTPTLEVHNPHNRILQITEMYSTGGDLHLELSDSRQDGEKRHWNIAPFQTKALMRAIFVARRENNHTAYIRIVPKSPVSDYMVVPIEVEVSGEQGLFFPSDTLHFGLLTPHDSPVSLPLHLLNSAPKHIHIQNIITSTVNEAVSIDFKPIKIPPGTVHPVQVATVTFDPSKVTNGVKVSGKLLIKSKVSAYKLSIPFSVDLHRGSLIYESSVTRFYSGSNMSNDTTTVTNSEDLSSSILGLETITLTTASSPTLPHSSSMPKNIDEPHNLFLQNTFNFPVFVYNITTPQEAFPLFKVKWFGPLIIAVSQSEKVAELRLLSAGTDIRRTVEIIVHTNVTSIKIPLVAYNGKLTKYIPPTGKESWLDFGTLGMGEHHDNYFYLLNENPVAILLKGWGSTLAESSVELMGIAEGNFTEINRNPNKTDLSTSLSLKPNHYAVFRIRILTPKSEGIFTAKSFVQTQYEVITLHFRVRTAEGLLTIFPNTLLFDNVFPGKISEQDIHILSTFGHSMTVENISPEIKDRRFTYSTPGSCTLSPILHPGVQSHIGSVVFDPSDQNHMYTGFSLHSKIGQQWVSTFPLSSHAIEFDSGLLSSRRQSFLKLPTHTFNLSLLLDTSEVKGYHFKAEVMMVWPHLVPVQEIKFSLTQVHNVSVQELQLTNPASEVVIVQILFLNDYPSPSSSFSILREHLNLNENISLEETINTESEVFSFINDHAENSDLHESFTRSRRILEAEFKTRVAKDSLVLQLEPHSQKNIRLSFAPNDERSYKSLILIRNNLTVVEAVTLEGRGGRGHIVFKNLDKDGRSFQFNIQEKHLKNCSKWGTDSVFMMRQMLIVKNEGLLPVDVYSLSIGGTPCESYGFKVVKCAGFSLHPNETRGIEILFTPDFSFFQVEQTLVMATSNASLKVSITANITPLAGAKCSFKVPRPNWEPLLYYSLVTVTAAMLVGVLTLSFLDAEHVLGSSFVPMTTVVPVNEIVPTFDKSKVFDLRALAAHDSPSADSTSDSSEASKNHAMFLKHVNTSHHPTVIKKTNSNNISNINISMKAKVKCENKATLSRKISKNDFGITSFLSSLPFALKREPKLLKGKKVFTKENESKIKPSEEELSSTTTESSSTDDICVFIKDNNLNVYEEKPRKRRHSRSGNSNGYSENCFSMKQTSHLNQCIETGFEITTKCKGIKKIKETTNKRNSIAIELPYTIKTLRNISGDDERGSKIKHKKTVEKTSSFSSQKESNRSPERRAPAKAIVAPSTRPPLINQPLAPRDPSYSSILLGNTKQKCTPVGKILPEVKPIIKPLGPIGQKISPTSVYSTPLKPMSSPPPFRPTDIYNSSVSVSRHSWDPKTFTAPMTDSNNWLSPSGQPTSFSMWSDTDHSLTAPPPTSSQTPPSLPSFSIWSSPWSCNPLSPWPNEPAFDSSFYDSLRPKNKDEGHS